MFLMCFSKNKDVTSCFVAFINSRESLAVVKFTLDFHEIINIFLYFNILKMSALIQLPKILTLTQKQVGTFLQKHNDECHPKIVVIH